ncbi:MAG: pentapeptide repeat-containing protein [Ktedonobacteraceae bacterium]
MKDKLINWWQKYRKLIVTTAIIALAVLALIRVGYLIDTAGFNGYHTVTIATAHSGKVPATVTRTEVEVPAKSFWDWMQLLIIPAMLAGGGLWLNQVQKSREDKAAEQRAKTERDAAEKRAKTELEIADDNQREAALQAYIAKLSELILEKDLCETNPGDMLRIIARTLTLTLLPRLDNKRKRSIVQFLDESNLIKKDKRIVDLAEADLSGADLGWTSLPNVNLSNANLSNANFFLSNLIEANLSGADLSEAHLSEASLSNANLIGTNLTNAELREANLGGVDLREANLYHADLRKAILKDANLNGDNPDNNRVTAVFMSEADLGGADLTGANLKEAILLSANLRDAIFNNANLTNAQVTKEQLEQAKLLAGATMPDGSTHP